MAPPQVSDMMAERVLSADDGGALEWRCFVANPGAKVQQDLTTTIEDALTKVFGASVHTQCCQPVEERTDRYMAVTHEIGLKLAGRTGGERPESKLLAFVDPQTGGALGSIDEPKLRPSGGDLRGLLRTTRTADEDSRTAGDSIEERVRGGADATEQNTGFPLRATGLGGPAATASAAQASIPDRVHPIAVTTPAPKVQEKHEKPQRAKASRPQSHMTPVVCADGINQPKGCGKESVRQMTTDHGD